MRHAYASPAPVGVLFVAGSCASAAPVVLQSAYWDPSWHKPYVDNGQMLTFIRDVGFDEVQLTNGWTFWPMVVSEGPGSVYVTEDTFMLWVNILGPYDIDEDDYYSPEVLTQDLQAVFSQMTRWNLTLTGVTGGAPEVVVEAMLPDAYLATWTDAAYFNLEFRWTLPRDVRPELNAADEWAFRVEAVPGPSAAASLVPACALGWARRRRR